MDILGGLVYGLGVSLEPGNLFACFVGVFVGTLIGVLPGIGPVATMSLLLPVTYAMSPTASIVLMAGVYYGAMYGGSTTSILVNIPGEAASVVTCLDGYQMARQGRAGPALGIAAFGSFIAGTLSVLGIMLLAPPLTSVALRFGPPEIFGLLLLGFTMVTYLTAGSKLKAVAMALLGMLLGTVGLDPIAASPRFTYGSVTLGDGLGLVPIIMGLFGISEVLLNIGHGVQPGPLLIKEHPEIFWGVITSMYVGNLMLLVLNLPLIGLWVQLLRVPYGILFPLILLFCVIGVYSESANVWDIVVMLAFGVIGLLMKRFGFEAAPLVLAFEPEALHEQTD